MYYCIIILMFLYLYFRLFYILFMCLVKSKALPKALVGGYGRSIRVGPPDELLEIVQWRLGPGAF